MFMLASESHKPVIALDIDGTMADYHGWFTKFAQLWTGRDMPAPDDINPGLPLHKHLHMSKANYRQCKLAYRQGGMKRSMPCYSYSRELTVNLRKAGAEIYICTTRPYLRLDNIDPDTRHWLKRNGIQYDGVLWGEHKYNNLIKIVGKDRILAIIDDLPAMCDQANKLGLFAILRDQPYNQHYHHYKRIYDLQEPESFLLRMVKRYKEDHK
jgi:phosphoglycolate phosphatase-like HAD superfamily hydrolase